MARFVSLLPLLLLSLSVPSSRAASALLSQLSSSQFSGFMTLLEQADVIPEIEAAVQSGDGLTIFAPTDDALMSHTSPTLLAFLKLKENKETLRKVIRSHVVPRALSPFQWEGSQKTLAGADLPLSMDSTSFYAGHVALIKYNAIVASDGVVHSIPSLILPNEVASNPALFLSEATEVRRVLLAGLAPAPSTLGSTGDQPPVTSSQTPSSSGVSASFAASVLLSVCSAAAAALLL